MDNKLMSKTKQELLAIIFRKDELEKKLRKEIKELHAKLYFHVSQENLSSQIIDKLEKKIKLYQIISIVLTIIVIVFGICCVFIYH